MRTQLYSRLASYTAALARAGLYFQSLTQMMFWQPPLPLSVVSLAAPKLFVADRNDENRENSGRLEWLPLDRVSSVL